MATIKKPATAQSTVVKPTVHFEGDKEHVLQTLFKGEQKDCPVIKSVGYARVPGVQGVGSYVAYVVTSQGDKVLSIEVEEPNTRYIAEESAKIAFVGAFMSEEKGE